MNNTNNFEFDDLQALLRFGHGTLTDTCFMLLDIVDVEAAKLWLQTAPISSALTANPPPDTALQVAFSVEGLRAMGLDESIINGFSDEFIGGMAGDENRSRRLGDVDKNAPKNWEWGGEPDRVPHILFLLYSRKDGNENWMKEVADEHFLKAFHLQGVLPTNHLGNLEPFGFVDGLSQPKIDWSKQHSTDVHKRDEYSNQLAVGEVVLGYRNEYGLHTTRPLVDLKKDSTATVLPDAEDTANLKDFGRNGSYLVIRQLHQDVPGFWKFIDKETGSDPEKRAELAAAMVGRKRDGSPLVPLSAEAIPGISSASRANHFTYNSDPEGIKCPIGAHVRRANPRTGDLPAGTTCIFSRLMRLLGFGKNRRDQDLIASSRFHRLLRRGRTYGPLLSPEDALKPELPDVERGLQFICMTANISRQFEFVQNAWMMNSTFGGVQRERDPLLGTREALTNGGETDQFNRPDPAGPSKQSCKLPQFVTVRGGGYFFMPGLKALQYIAATANTEMDTKP